jgi:hypothetical protein
MAVWVEAQMNEPSDVYHKIRQLTKPYVSQTNIPPRSLDSAQVSDNERELMVPFGQQERLNDADNNGQSSIQLILRIVDG